MRSRLAEHFNRIVREDCLTLFNRTVDISNLQCSIVLANASQIPPEFKYKAAAVLEVLTGQLPTGNKCQVDWEHPLARKLSKEEESKANQARSAFLVRQQRTIMPKAKQAAKPGEKSGKGPVKHQLTSEDFKEAAAAFKLSCSLSKVGMWDFLEKLREFCLPDVTGGMEERLVKGMLERGHSNEREIEEIRRQFQRVNVSKNPLYAPRIALGINDNPLTATTAYVLKAHELLKFPDIEVHFEALGSVLSATSGSAEDTSKVQLILRPTLKVEDAPLDQESLKFLGPTDNLKSMNYLLAQFFNEYYHRPLGQLR